MRNHKNNRQLWLIGIINNNTKEFRIEASFNRDATTLSKFIYKYVEIWNTIVSDGWAGYNFFNSTESGFNHITHLHQGGIFGFGLQSTSHIEAIWNVIKAKIKNIYHFIPSFHLMHFVREAEYRYIIRTKSEDDKIKDLFECYKLMLDVNDVQFPKTFFFSDSEENNADEGEEISEDSDE